MTLHVALYTSGVRETVVAEAVIVPRSGDFIVLDDGRRARVAQVFIAADRVGVVAAVAKDSTVLPWVVGEVAA